MKLRYNMLAVAFRDKHVEGMIKKQKLHLMDCATLTKTHPGRLIHMSAPNPSWPPSAQRSFMAAMKIDRYLQRYLTENMNYDLRIHFRLSREEDNEHSQAQKMQPLWWRMVCGLKHERLIVPPPPVSYMYRGRKSRGGLGLSTSERMQRDAKARNAQKKG